MRTTERPARGLRRVAPSRATATGPWVFAYGSLMWAPGFPVIDRQPAVLRGYHRALCILSVRNRGTLEKPGLALGLAPGGSCRGLALRVPAWAAVRVRRQLWAREMATQAYVALRLPLRLADGRKVRALVFVARRDGRQYARGLPPRECARLVAQGVGAFGTALDYVRETLGQLPRLGVKDRSLTRVLRLAETLARATSD